MYEKKDTYRNYYSHSKITQSKNIRPQVYESLRDKTHLSSFQNFLLKKKSKSDLYTSLNGNYIKPKLNLNISSLKQKSINVKTEKSQTFVNDKDRSIGKKLENYKIKKLQQKIKQSSQNQKNRFNFLESPRIVASVSESKKNLSARKHIDTKPITAEKKIENHQRTVNLQIDTDKLNEFFQNKKPPTNVPQTTKTILQYSQYNKALKKSQMGLRPFEDSKTMFKRMKDQPISHTQRQDDNEQKFDPFPTGRDNYTPKASKRSANEFLASFERKTVKKEKPEMLSIKDFQIFKQLGKGQNGKIYSAFHKKTGIMVALKHFQQHKIIIDYLIDEMKIQLFCTHPNILAAYGYIIEKSSTIDTCGGVGLDQNKNKNRTFYNIYIIMEKGDMNLFSLIKKERQLSEENAAIFAQQILNGLKFLHTHKIIHRDLKPENIIVINGVCKITDFGWSVIGSQQRETFCGTLEYVSPQVAVGSRYDNKIDIWSVGVLIFEMLTGEAPYDTNKILHNPRDEYRKKILSRLPLNSSYECKDIVSKLLKIDPKDRISIDQALNHKWIREAMARKTLNKNIATVTSQFSKILKS